MSLHSIADGEDTNTDKPCDVDMKEGLVVALDTKRHTLEFLCGNRSYGVASATVIGQGFRPFLVFIGQARHAIRLQYLGGQKSRSQEKMVPWEGQWLC